MQKDITARMVDERARMCVLHGGIVSGMDVPLPLECSVIHYITM